MTPPFHQYTDEFIQTYFEKPKAITIYKML